MSKVKLVHFRGLPFNNYPDVAPAIDALIKKPDMWAVLEVGGRNWGTFQQYIYQEARKLGHGAKVMHRAGKLYVKLKVNQPNKRRERVKTEHSQLPDATKAILRGLGK